MPSADHDATPQEIRSFARVQLGLTAAFLVLLFFMLGGKDADFPPVWLTVLLLVLVAGGAFLAERVWLSGSPLSPDEDPQEARRDALGIYASQTVRKLFFCEAPLLVAVVVGFVADHGGWPLVIAGFPGLAVLAWETWPSLRNTSMTAVVLDSAGAESQLVESFLTS